MISISCSTMQNIIQKNKKITDKTIASVFKKNDNVFYLTSTHASFSAIWSYKDEKIEIYKIANAKIYDKVVYNSDEIFEYQIPPFNELNSEFNECGYEIDGDVFGYSIKRVSEIENQDLPISIICFTKLNYKSEFLNKVINDINTYNIWDVSY